MSNEVIELFDDIKHVDTIWIDDDENGIIWDVTYKKHKLFSEFVNKCLNLSDSKGVIRVLNKILLPAFKDLDHNYKESKRFEKILSRTITLIDTDPLHKFAYIKNLYETLKLHKIRKKVEFVTITNNIKEKTADNEIKRKTDYNFNSNKKPRAGASGSVCNNTPAVINLDKCEHDVLIEKDNAHTNVESDHKELYKKIAEVSDTLMTVMFKCNKISPNSVSPINDDSEKNEVQTDFDIEEISCDNTLLMPKIFKVFHKTDAEEVIEKLQKIEKKIALYKKKIEMLDELAVDDDTNSSPYILCERYKVMIVALYKEWCDLTGRESVKRSEVRLKVQDGHPPGPVQRLEKHINDNIGPDGHPPFPDFRDVVKCVIASNQEDGLGWNMSQILREARALFMQCGRALQARRQRREWRLLMSRVKDEDCDNDPAINNHELEACLQANRNIALKKEAEILERFSMIESLPSKKNNETGDSINKDLDSDTNDNSSDLEDLIILDEKLYSKNTIANVDELQTKVKMEPEGDTIKVPQEIGQSCSATTQDIEDPSLVIEISSDSSSDDE